jgi:dihydrofolate synthase/folylpolyglutamate synthase
MTYTEALAYLDTFLNYEKTALNADLPKHFNLRRVAALLAAMGDPHHAVPVVHVAGTKGKGSTCAFVSAVLREAGYRVGLFTSPHLVSPRERLQVGGACVAAGEFAELVRRARSVLDAHRATDNGRLTFFEVYTALAFRHFAEARADIAVLEVGMGGRLDATNVVIPVLSVITPIGLDHTAALGNTLGRIAREKAGIIKPGRPVVVAHQQPSARDAILQAAADRHAPVVEVDVAAGSEREGIWSGREHCHLHRGDCSLRDLSLRLVGAHQVANAATAFVALTELRRTGWRIPDVALRSGLDAAWAAARFQVGRGPGGSVLVLDCAHTLESAQALSATLADFFGGRRVSLVVGMSADKNADAFARALSGMAAQVVVTRARTSSRSADPTALLEAWRHHCADVSVAGSVEEAVERAVAKSAEQPLCVTGSVYLAGEALQSVASDHWSTLQQEVGL